MTAERLSWEEIKTRYPDQWVGLTDVLRSDKSADIVSAILLYTDKSQAELTRMQIRDDNLVSRYTTPNNLTAQATTAGC